MLDAAVSMSKLQKCIVLLADRISLIGISPNCECMLWFCKILMDCWKMTYSLLFWNNDVFAGQDFEVPDVSKAMTVRKFRTLVKNVTEVDPKLQSLYFGGKVMHDECDLCDYRIVSWKQMHISLAFTEASLERAISPFDFWKLCFGIKFYC